MTYKSIATTPQVTATSSTLVIIGVAVAFFAASWAVTHLLLVHSGGAASVSLTAALSAMLMGIIFVFADYYGDPQDKRHLEIMLLVSFMSVDFIMAVVADATLFWVVGW